MNQFSLENSSEHYLQLSQQPVRFEPSSSVTNIFFDDTNGQVFTVRSGGVTGVTVNGMDPSTRTSFTMEDKGSVMSIKFSPDQTILAIQRSRDNQHTVVEFMNFKDLAPTNVEYSHSCKWRNAKILGFVWPKNYEIAFVTDHGIELLQVLPEKKQLKSLKSMSFSGAWFSWCTQSKIVLLAGNNGGLLQPFSLNNSTISKLQKLELDTSKPIAERDVSVVRVCNTTWCALIRHGSCPSTPGPAELSLTPLTGPPGVHSVHVLKTGLVGRFAVNIVDDLVVVHHQASQTSLLFDIMEESKLENNTVIHIPIVQAKMLKPCFVDDQLCPLYSGHWVVQQPDYIIDVRLGCLWRVHLAPAGLPHRLPKDEIHKIVAVLHRRTDGKETLYAILNQMVADAGTCLVEIAKVFDEINSVYRRWAEAEAGAAPPAPPAAAPRRALAQADMLAHVFQHHADAQYIVQVLTSYIASLCRFELPVQGGVAELCATTLVRRGQCHRLRQCIRHGCLGDSRALACLLLSLANLDPAAAQLALDMLWRLRAYEEVVEVLLSWRRAAAAAGAARQAGAGGAGAWRALAPRKLLAAARRAGPAAFAALYHALRRRNRAARGAPDFLRGEQCDAYVQYYNEIMS